MDIGTPDYIQYALSSTAHYEPPHQTLHPSATYKCVDHLSSTFNPPPALPSFISNINYTNSDNIAPPEPEDINETEIKGKNINGREEEIEEEDYFEDEEEEKSLITKKKTSCGRRKIAIEFISNKSRRNVTFSKRKKGLIKKARELEKLTGSQVMVMILSESGSYFDYASPKFRAMANATESSLYYPTPYPDVASNSFGPSNSSSGSSDIWPTSGHA